MSRYLVDTNVLSELSRPQPARIVTALIRSIPTQDSFLSDVTIAEIRYGAENVAIPSRRAAVLSWLRDEIRPHFAGRILPLTEDILLRWRWIVELNRKSGYTFDQSDSLLAATALHHDLTVLTRDTAPFARAEVPTLNPWRPR